MSNIHIVNVGLDDRSYEILASPGILGREIPALNRLVNGRKCHLITDSNVAPLYAAGVEKLLSSAGAVLSRSVLPAGEEYKTLASCGKLYGDMIAAGLDRGSLAVALGGGVTGDMTGFAAATYMRGIAFIQIPSTLLAMVDSSVGGKTGIDLPEGKNLVGAFWQPSLVLIDPQLLRSLPPREIRCGLAEIVKYAVILDAALFDRLEQNIAPLLVPDLACYTPIITRCCELKAEVVANDETEKGQRALLNYGHTFGHAIEAVSNFKIGHGEGVAIGMAMAADLAVQLGLFSADEAQRQEKLLQALGLPSRVPAGYQAAEIVNAMGRDKKKQGSGLVFILPEVIGRAEICRGIDIDQVTQVVGARCD